MSKQLQNYEPINKISYMTNINKFFITGYSASFTHRNFTHMRLSSLGKLPYIYFPLLGMMAKLYNCFALSQDSIITLVGRKIPISNMGMNLKLIVGEIVMRTEGEKNRPFKLKDPTLHGNSVIGQFKSQQVKSFEQDIKGIWVLKTEFYLDKYASLLQVREKEIMDRLFVNEYIREMNLTNQKRLKWPTDNQMMVRGIIN